MNLQLVKTNVAHIVAFFNPLDWSDSKAWEVDAGIVFFDWLQETYPDGFGSPIKIIRNDHEVALEDMDFVVEHDDLISIIVSPGGDPITIALIAAAISAVATIAASLVVYLIFGKPKKPKDQPGADPVYSIQGGANMVRLGEPIPVVYGRVITYPDTATQPYSFFENNEMYIDQILCLGQGEFHIENVLISDTPSSSLAPGVLAWIPFTAAEHGQAMGNIQNATGIRENIVTSIEVADQELNGYNATAPTDNYIQRQANTIAPNQFQLLSDFPAALAPGSAVTYYWVDWPVISYDAATGRIVVDTMGAGNSVGTANNVTVYLRSFIPSDSSYVSGPFIASNPGFPGTYIEVDFVWPQGMYTIEDDGDMIGKQVDMTVVAEAIDDNNNPLGPSYNLDISHSWDKSTPSRITRGYNVPLGRYRVKVIRHTGADTNNKVQSTFNWTGLKFMLANVPGQVYGNTTLIAVRLRATNGISSDAANKIRVVATRKLPRFGSGGLVPTRSPADAFIDACTNTTYGLGRPLSAVDVATMQFLENHWTPAYALFDGIFNQKTTVWEALGIILQPVAAIPVRNGKLISAVSDGRKVAPMQLFSDANIVEDSFQASYEFDRPGEYAGIQVEYRDPVNFSQVFAVYPPGAVDLENVNLFGCTTRTIAEQYAKLLWQRRTRLRQFCAFQTELEGFIPMVSSRVLVSTNAVAWGESGEVVQALASNILMLDRTVNLANYVNPFIVLRDMNGAPTSRISIVGSDGKRSITLATNIPIAIQPLLSDQRATEWAIGDLQRKVKDFTIQSVSHNAENVTDVKAVIYDERVWAGTLPFLEVPI